MLIRRIKRITEAPWEFQRSIWSVYLGDPSRKKALEITDEVVAAMIRALPKLKHRKTLEHAPWPPKLVYLELSGQQLPASIIQYFEYWTSRKRSAEPGESLEIVYNFGPYYIFWRDGFPRWCKDWPFQREGAWHRNTDWVLGLEPDEEAGEEAGEESGEESGGASDEGFYEISD
ncbi:uncharacterized protein J4E88_003803 [Alternaria novae-zelandiae]|uniref:uncharacterized protein n=1 Tax=Alternaria novae-zelandiae TaxID=430562 RepID=UPI0020C20962|nr:uncharacterized protein J4E88_003803 [Alternaria novae-zelandiae]KAI4685966.1 hypothetical protein J4E88_003803 [Alternaria novae-zelandiae]